MTDRDLEQLIVIAILVTIGAFWPLIRKLLHRIGYRDWRDRNK